MTDTTRLASHNHPSHFVNISHLRHVTAQKYYVAVAAHRETFTLLVVCAANHCRSRTIESLFKDKDIPILITESAGVDVRDTLPICPQAADWLASRGITADMSSDSRPLTREMVDACDLVVCADSSVRARVVELAPAVREKVIPVKWAAAAAAALIENDVVDRALSAFHTGEDKVVEALAGESFMVARALDPNDFQLWLSRELRSAPSLNHPPSGWDIPDPHLSRHEIHMRVFEQAEAAVNEISAIVKLVYERITVNNR